MFKKIMIASTAIILTAFIFTTQQSFAQMPPDEGMGNQNFENMGGPMNGQGRMGQFKERFGKFRQGKNHKGGGMMKMFKELNLTDEQKETLKSQKETAKEQIKGLRTQLKTEREKLMDMMFNPSASKSEMLAQQDKVNSIQNQLAKVRIENLATLKEILTPEQKSKMQTIAQEKKAMMQQRRQQFEEKRRQFKERRKQFKQQGEEEPYTE